MAKKILLVDDERRVLTVVREMLVRQGYEVRLATNGEDALELAAAESFDLVLLDLVLPGIDGATVAQTLKERPRTRETPVVFFTGLIEAAVARRRDSHFGGHFFLAKPFDAEELYDLVERAIGDGMPASHPNDTAR